MYQISDEAKASLSLLASNKAVEREEAGFVLASAVDAAIYKIQILDGAMADGIFYADDSFTLGGRVEYPVDILKTNDIKKFKAWNASSPGSPATRMVFADQFTLDTYIVKNSLSWPLDIIKASRYDMLQRYLQVYADGLVMKNNDDAWRVLLTAAKARTGGFVTDAAAASGKLTPLLLDKLKVEMRKRGGGNTSATGRRSLTDLFVPTTGLAQMRTWTVTDVPEEVRYQIWNSDNGQVSMPGVQFHTMDEFDDGGEYSILWEDLTGTDYGSSDTDFVIGMDLSNKPMSFVHPIVERFHSSPEGEAYYKEDLGGIFGKGRWSWGVLDDRYIIVGTY